MNQEEIKEQHIYANKGRGSLFCNRTVIAIGKKYGDNVDPTNTRIYVLYAKDGCLYEMPLSDFAKWAGSCVGIIDFKKQEQYLLRYKHWEDHHVKPRKN